MELDNRQKHLLYAAVAAWKEIRGQDALPPSRLKQLKDLATEGGELKELSGAELDELLGVLAGGGRTKDKPFNRLKIKKWLRHGEFENAGVRSVAELLEVAGRMLDKAHLQDTAPVLQLEDGRWYVVGVHYVIDEANPELVEELQEETHGDKKTRQSRRAASPSRKTPRDPRDRGVHLTPEEE